jgi:hypothetical protein
METLVKHRVKSPHVYLLAVLIALAFSSKAIAECTHKLVSTLRSPDDTWIAVVQEITCSNDAFGMTTIVDQLGLVRPGAETRFGEAIFAVDIGGNWRSRPLTRWLTSTKLEVMVPNFSLIGLHKCDFEGVEVLVKFDPEDPAARERWLKSLGIPIKEGCR